MTAAGWLIASGALSAMVIVVVVVRLRHAGRTLDVIMTEHHARMAQQPERATAATDVVVPDVPVRRQGGAHRRQPEDGRRRLSA